MFNDGEIWSGGVGGEADAHTSSSSSSRQRRNSFIPSSAAGGSNQFGSHFCHSLGSSGGFQTIQVDPLLYITRASKEFKEKEKKNITPRSIITKPTHKRADQKVYKSSFAGKKGERPADIGSSSAIISCCCWRNVQFHLFH